MTALQFSSWQDFMLQHELRGNRGYENTGASSGFMLEYILANQERRRQQRAAVYQEVKKTGSWAYQNIAKPGVKALGRGVLALGKAAIGAAGNLIDKAIDRRANKILTDRLEACGLSGLEAQAYVSGDDNVKAQILQNYIARQNQSGNSTQNVESSAGTFNSHYDSAYNSAPSEQEVNDYNAWFNRNSGERAEAPVIRNDYTTNPETGASDASSTTTATLEEKAEEAKTETTPAQVPSEDKKERTPYEIIGRTNVREYLLETLENLEDRNDPNKSLWAYTKDRTVAELADLIDYTGEKEGLDREGNPDTERLAFARDAFNDESTSEALSDLIAEERVRAYKTPNEDILAHTLTQTGANKSPYRIIGDEGIKMHVSNTINESVERGESIVFGDLGQEVFSRLYGKIDYTGEKEGLDREGNPDTERLDFLKRALKPRTVYRVIGDMIRTGMLKAENPQEDYTPAVEQAEEAAVPIAETPRTEEVVAPIVENRGILRGRYNPDKWDEQEYAKRLKNLRSATREEMPHCYSSVERMASEYAKSHPNNSPEKNLAIAQEDLALDMIL